MASQSSLLEHCFSEEYQQQEKEEEVEDREYHPLTFLKRRPLIRSRHQVSQHCDSSISNADCDGVECCESPAAQGDHSGLKLDGVAGQC
ncbi:hypothetical protein ONS95_005060 [Cadophora gregata]|uniref:uncharacterized protein n=1 Tax=Cadophora gregata TaxID=51156 RepID=UPI0026DB660F|nr:uncharacterized protein ONS95_005060 [Cadophora gregata]KAK0104793.1 hypothetical protein ONS95_005060 [Cadophora gregata]